MIIDPRESTDKNTNGVYIPKTETFKAIKTELINATKEAPIESNSITSLFLIRIIIKAVPINDAIINSNSIF